MDEDKKNLEDEAIKELTEATEELTAEREVNKPVETPVAEAPIEKPTEPQVAPVSPAAPVAPVVEEVTEPEAKKKSKKGLIIGLTAGALVLAGAGVGVAYAVTNTPENIALSAISGFFNTNAHNINGTFDLTLKSSTDSDTNCSEYQIKTTNCRSVKNPLEKVSITLSSDTNESAESNTTADLNVTYDGKEYKISLGTVIIKDYTVYISVSGLKDLSNQVVDMISETQDEFYADLYEELFDSVVGEVEGNWWKISVPELVDEIKEVSTSDRTKMKETYSCVTDAFSKLQNNTNKYVEIYQKNAFIKLDNYKGGKTFSGKGTPYNVTFDAEKLANFTNEMTTELDSLGINKCLEKANGISGVSTSYEVKKVTKADVEKTLENIPDIVVTVNSFLFSHELTGVYVEKDDSSYSGKLDLTFGKQKDVIKAPENAKSVTTLYETVVKEITELQKTAECKYIEKAYPRYFNLYCDANYHLGQNYEVQPNANI